MSLAEKYIREGHPTVDELITVQRITFPRDPHAAIYPSAHAGQSPAAG